VGEGKGHRLRSFSPLFHETKEWKKSGDHLTELNQRQPPRGGVGGVAGGARRSRFFPGGKKIVVGGVRGREKGGTAHKKDLTHGAHGGRVGKFKKKDQKAPTGLGRPRTAMGAPLRKEDPRGPAT